MVSLLSMSNHSISRSPIKSLHIIIQFRCIITNMSPKVALISFMTMLLLAPGGRTASLEGYGSGGGDYVPGMGDYNHDYDYSDASLPYIVGYGDDNWTGTGHVDYQAWASEHDDIKVGDALVFIYKPPDNVLRVSAQDFESCNASSPIATYDGGLNVIHLDMPGDFYYICGFDEHCQAGQKLHVVAKPRNSATAAKTSAAASPTPATNAASPAPTTSPTTSPGSATAPSIELVSQPSASPAAAPVSSAASVFCSLVLRLLLVCTMLGFGFQ